MTCKNNKKVIAYYLPQFHPIVENDNWWGKGFTEWDNVKKAKPLFDGHKQPRIPQNNNYYNLLDEKTQKWQANLAKKYGLFGFCYYHYWFSGKLLLEKPLEKMLVTPEVDIPFCLAWANESWTRTWDGDNKTCLIEQRYGDIEEWHAHLMYLLDFFEDPRYIRINNKPMFLLYSSSRIVKCKEMIAYWELEIKKHGFNGIYIVEMLNCFNKKEILPNSSAITFYEPNFTREMDLKSNSIFSKVCRYVRTRILKNMLTVESIDSTYDFIEKRKYNTNKTVYDGTFNDWDNTARKGKRGALWLGASPSKFECHLKKLLAKKNTGEYLFVNAWNEWGECAYLEPDELNGLSYLKAIQKALQYYE